MKISIIIEWENVLLSELDRCRRMLQIIYEQSVEIHSSVEMIILNNPEQVSIESVITFFKKNLTIDPSNSVKVRFEESPDSHYYELKNFGADRATGDIIVFVDTDVIPEDKWLHELVTPFMEDPTVNVIAGNTYVDPIDSVNKAFALGWFFPMREKDSWGSKSVQEFYANNVAFRKSLFLQYYFPPMPFGMTRGSCEILAKKLYENNIPILMKNAAQTKHPAPNGWKHIIVRALANGRDRVLRKRMDNNSVLGSYGYMYQYAYVRIKQTFCRSFHQYDYFQLSKKEKIMAYMLMISYYTLVILGATFTTFSPKMTSKWWRI